VSAGAAGVWGLTFVLGRVVAAHTLLIFFIDPCAGRQLLSLPLAKESNQRKRLGRQRCQDVIWLAVGIGRHLSVALALPAVLARSWSGSRSIRVVGPVIHPPFGACAPDA
jgi:hypothetical protein